MTAWKVGFENFSLSSLSLATDTRLGSPGHRRDSVDELGGRSPCQGFAVHFDDAKQGPLSKINAIDGEDNEPEHAEAECAFFAIDSIIGFADVVSVHEVLKKGLTIEIFPIINDDYSRSRFVVSIRQ